MRSSHLPRILKIAALLCAFLVLLCGFAVWRHGSHHAVVLEYHCVEEISFSPSEELFVRPDDLADQIRALQKDGYRFVFAGEVSPLCFRKTVCLTFDDGYKDNLTELLPILEETGAKATVFVAADLIGFSEYSLTDEELKILAESPYVEIGSHGVSHRDFLGLTDEELREELLGSKALLEELTGQNITVFSYPGGHYTWEQAKQAGEVYRNCFTAAGGNHYLGLRNHRNVLPRIPVRRGETGPDLIGKLRAATAGWDVYSGY